MHVYVELSGPPYCRRHWKCKLSQMKTEGEATDLQTQPNKLVLSTLSDDIRRSEVKVVSRTVALNLRDSVVFDLLEDTPAGWT